MKKLYSFLAILLILLTVRTITFAMTKESIIALSRAGARDEVIIMHIKNQCCPPLEISEIGELVNAGVSQKVVDFIISYQEHMPAYCEHSEKYKQLQELKEQLRTKYKFEEDNKVY